jgi:hypothetical protein
MKDSFREFLAEFINKSTFQNREYLPTLWIMAESALEIYPDQYSWTIEPENVKPEWVIDIKSLNTWYWSDIVKRVNAITSIYSFRLRDLFHNLEDTISENAVRTQQFTPDLVVRYFRNENLRATGESFLHPLMAG